MTRALWTYTSQLIWEQTEMYDHYKATFFRKEIMDTRQPVLTFRRRVLEPYDVQYYGATVHLHYTKDAPDPASPDAWCAQLRAQGYALVRRGRLANGTLEIICERIS